MVPTTRKRWPRKEVKEIQKKPGIFRSPSHNWEAATHLSDLSDEAPHEEPGTGRWSLPLGKTGTGALKVDWCVWTQGLLAQVWVLGLALTQEGQHHCLCPHLAMLATLASCTTHLSGGVGWSLHSCHKAPSEANTRRREIQPLRKPRPFSILLSPSFDNFVIHFLWC